MLKRKTIQLGKWYRENKKDYVYEYALIETRFKEYEIISMDKDHNLLSIVIFDMYKNAENMMADLIGKPYSVGL